MPDEEVPAESLESVARSYLAQFIEDEQRCISLAQQASAEMAPILATVLEEALEAEGS